MGRVLALGLSALFISSSLHASIWRPTWGPEITFTRPDVANADHGATGIWPWSEQNQAALEEFFAFAKKAAKGRADIRRVRYLEKEDRWGFDVVRVEYADGWSYDVTLDPYCLEVKPHHFTLADLKNKYQTRIREDIYEWMAGIGMKPDRMVGGGHLHAGAESTFEGNVLFFRNWLADRANHGEMASGVMECDDSNCAPFFKMSRGQREKFRLLLERADRGEFTKVRRLASAFVAEVLFDGQPATGRRIMDNKYWQDNVMRMANLDTWETLADPHRTWADYEAFILYDDVPKPERTAEYRTRKMQFTVEDLIADIELEEGRLGYLRGMTTPLALTDDFLKGKKPTVKQSIAGFIRYVQESGLDPMRYREWLPTEGDGIRNWKQWRLEFDRQMAAASCPRKMARRRG